MNENEAIFRRWMQEVWNENKLGTIDELFDENGTAACPIYKDENTIRGVAALKSVFYQAKQILLDTIMTIEEISIENEKVVALCRLSAEVLIKDAHGNVKKSPINNSALFQMKIAEGKIYEIWSDLKLS